MARFNVYYELSDYAAENATVFGQKGKYFAFLLRQKDETAPEAHYQLTRYSDRVWQEFDDGEVILLKNRRRNIFDTVDLKEFMWIKLQAVNLN